jgi:hypothetical protein
MLHTEQVFDIYILQRFVTIVKDYFPKVTISWDAGAKVLLWLLETGKYRPTEEERGSPQRRGRWVGDAGASTALV